jgi:hypothetical protein
LRPVPGSIPNLPRDSPFTARLVADEAKPKGNCIVDAFATNLGITPEQKLEIQKVYADSEQKYMKATGDQ